MHKAKKTNSPCATSCHITAEKTTISQN